VTKLLAVSLHVSKLVGTEKVLSAPEMYRHISIYNKTTTQWGLIDYVVELFLAEELILVLTSSRLGKGN